MPTTFPQNGSLHSLLHDNVRIEKKEKENGYEIKYYITEIDYNHVRAESIRSFERRGEFIDENAAGYSLLYAFSKIAL